MNWESLVSDIPAGDGNVANLFYGVLRESCPVFVKFFITVKLTIQIFPPVGREVGVLKFNKLKLFACPNLGRDLKS
jgi:hypothetical protein